MKVSVNVKTDPRTNQKLINCTDKQLYAIARKTLDMTIPKIPRDTGRMRLSSSGFRGTGVVKTTNGYAIGSDTYYASKVWNYPDTTHWTTPGTNGEWYLRVWNRNRNQIINMALVQNKLR